MGPTDDSYDLTLAASTLRANVADVHVLLKALSSELAESLGPRLRLEYAGGRFRKSDVITALHILMGNDSFDAIVEGPVLRCSVGHSSGGIRIRSENVEMDEWIVRLLGALQTEAAHSESARLALEHIVIGGIS